MSVIAEVMVIVVVRGRCNYGAGGGGERTLHVC